MASIRAKVKDKLVALIDARFQQLHDARTPNPETSAQPLMDTYARHLRACACEREGALPIVNIWNATIEGDELAFTFEFQPLNDASVERVEFSGAQTRTFANLVEKNGWLKLQARIPMSSEAVVVLSRLHNGGAHELCRIVPEYYRGFATYAAARRDIAASVETPSGDVVFVTQGHHNAPLYELSVLTGVFHFRSLLSHTGRTPESIRSILDLGCGTGRILKGWYVDDPTRDLFGTDYNPALIEWARVHFPASVHFDVNRLVPPLRYERESFDLVYLCSVFTHLSLQSQFIWLNELKRILRPDGLLVITLHGLNFLDQIRRDRPHVFDSWIRDRYCEENLDARSEGSNGCGTLHLPDFAYHKLFSGWNVVGYYPGGRIANHRMEGQFQHLQDVYVLRVGDSPKPEGA
jgi:SAM-dependent methyltransferase